MQQSVIVLSTAEGIASERALLRNETRPLQAATGFVLGSALSGALWTVAGLLVWYLV